MANSFRNVKQASLSSLVAIVVAGAGGAMLLALFPAKGLAAPEGDATIQTDSFAVQAGQAGTDRPSARPAAASSGVE